MGTAGAGMEAAEGLPGLTAVGWQGAMGQLWWLGGCCPSTPSPSSASLALGCWHRQRRMGNTTSHFAGLKIAIGSSLLCLSLLLVLFTGGETPKTLVCLCSFSPYVAFLLYTVII